MTPTECHTTPDTADAWPRLTFGLTILLSAFLLFQVQPLISKAILPWFGGLPAVWTTCLLFFQLALFGGYLYAHLLQRWFSTRKQVIVHLALAAAAMALLPILPDESRKPTDSLYPTWRILVLLTVSVGLPYFVLSATSPLVQAWFSRRCPGRSPYRLYALSNIGSLAALLSYPIFFEPTFVLPKQSALWSVGFVAYAGLCLASLVCLWRLRQHQDEQWSRLCTAETGSTPDCPVDQAAASGNGHVGWTNRFRWLALPAVASLMLLAGTNHICQDVAVVPFLWVMPLALYLLSFIICFDHPRWYIRPLWTVLTILALMAVGLIDLVRYWSSLGLVPELALNLAAIFSICMVCHGELARLKPRPLYLTEYYLLISAGGALGGLFVALIAPHVFKTYLEWPLGMMISSMLAVGLLILPRTRHRLVRYLVLAPMALAALSFLVCSQIEPQSGSVIYRDRNFFGAITVTEHHYSESPSFDERVLKNGRIIHGLQPLDKDKREWPTSYYAEDSGIGMAMEHLHKARRIRVGTVGLGAGSLAAYAESGDAFTFYEINPKVLHVANDYFTYLADARRRRATVDVVMGDARLSMVAQPPQEYNLIVLDAFSGDAIPTHLLTREALEVYRGHLAPNGIIAIHISNRYLRLGPVVYGLAEDCGMSVTRVSSSGDNERFLYSSEWMLVTQDDDFIRSHPPVRTYSDGDTASHFDDEDLKVPLWTDQYSNLFQILVPPSSEPLKHWYAESWKKCTEWWEQHISKKADDQDSSDSE